MNKYLLAAVVLGSSYEYQNLTETTEQYLLDLNEDLKKQVYDAVLIGPMNELKDRLEEIFK